MRVKITEQWVHDEGGNAAPIRMVPDLRNRPFCHSYGSPAATVHSQGHRRYVRDLNLAQSQVWLRVTCCKIWCSECNCVRVEQLGFADASKRITHRLAQYVHDLCKVMTVQDVAEHLEMNPKTVKAIDKCFLEKSFEQTNEHGLWVLAIDEIALRKGHHYMTVVMDYFSRSIVWMGQGRSQDILAAFFAELTSQQIKY